MMMIWSGYSIVCLHARCKQPLSWRIVAELARVLVKSTPHPRPVSLKGRRVKRRRWPVSLSQLGYRPWRGKLGSSLRSIWPISRVALLMVFRQKFFWVLYILALMTFLVFFFGIYLFSQIDTEA